MSHPHHTHSPYHPIFNSSYDTIPSSSSSLSFNQYHASPNNQSSLSRNSLLRVPDTSETRSRITNSRNTDLIYHDNQQPHLNPHARFLNRSIETCPKHLTGSKQTKWLKTGTKARHNQALLTNCDSFHWPTSHYDAPIHIHHQTPLNIVRSLIQRVSSVHLFTIDTESDKPSIQQPRPVAALIQIQAIHNEHSATVILIEVQHLPHQSTILFQHIQQLCHLIFSCTNKIMGWGEVIAELQPFLQFHLFDISNVTNHFNIQQYFTDEWNKTHPHTTECANRHQPIADDNESSEFLICLVRADDLDDDFTSSNSMNDYNTCICPDSIRPYKTANAIWSLQKAIHRTFDKALDKAMTLNIWSCGLDQYLHTSYSDQDKRTRENLIDYAINDLFGPTHFYFHLHQLNCPSQSSIITPHLNTIMSTETGKIPSFFILSDSHGRRLPPKITTADYHITTHAISGLHWINKYNSNLCARSVILSLPTASIISKSNRILLFLGTNSVRNTLAHKIIEQITDIINIIRSQHVHLNQKSDISIVFTFPCLKVSSMFPSTDLLISNISTYNDALQLLSVRMNFSCVNFQINPEHLHHDLIHLRYEHQTVLYDSILSYFNALVIPTSTISPSKHRSREALTRRNKKKHEKMKPIRQQHTLTKSIHTTWKLHDIKALLKFHDIKFARLPEIYHHQLRIQFNNESYKAHAAQILSSVTLDEPSYHTWCLKQL